MTKKYEIETNDKQLQRQLEMAKLKVQFHNLGVRRIPTEWLRDCKGYNKADASIYSNAWQLRSVSKKMLKIYEEALSKVEVC